MIRQIVRWKNVLDVSEIKSYKVAKSISRLTGCVINKYIAVR